MPFVLVLVGILMIVTGVQGTYVQFASQVGKDFTGPGNFLYWLAAIGVVGAVGYVETLQTVSRMFIALIIIAMFLSNKGVFAKLQQALKQGPTTPQPGLALGGGATSGNNTTASVSNLTQPTGGPTSVGGWFSQWWTNLTGPSSQSQTLNIGGPFTWHPQQ